MISVEVLAYETGALRRDVGTIRSAVPVLPSEGAGWRLCDPEEGAALPVSHCEITIGQELVYVILDTTGWSTEDLVSSGFPEAT
jgi:hypothetical protein